jgi:hypothetical protein
MVAGRTVDDVALILGDDPDTVRKHYLKWSREYQERTTTLLDMVAKVGVEPVERQRKNDLHRIIAAGVAKRRFHGRSVSHGTSMAQELMYDRRRRPVHSS